MIKKLVDFVVIYMNDLIFQYLELKMQCYKLVLKEIKSFFCDMLNVDMQFFDLMYCDEKCDLCGLNYGKKLMNILVWDIMYQLQFVMLFNEGFYEVFVRMKKGILLFVGGISCLDVYGY